MPQEFQCLRCCECRTFQVHQVKKVKKWSCKICNVKQSVIKVFGQGSGADCRRHVQKLNMMRKDEDSASENVFTIPSTHHGTHQDNEPTPCATNPVESRWGQFLEEESSESAVVREDDTDEGEFTTSRHTFNQHRIKYRGKKRKEYGLVDLNPTQKKKSMDIYWNSSINKPLASSSSANLFKGSGFGYIDEHSSNQMNRVTKTATRYQQKQPLNDNPAIPVGDSINHSTFVVAGVSHLSPALDPETRQSLNSPPPVKMKKCKVEKFKPKPSEASSKWDMFIEEQEGSEVEEKSEEEEDWATLSKDFNSGSTSHQLEQLDKSNSQKTDFEDHFALDDGLDDLLCDL